ncbi:MAG: peptide chain release factor N(5)-glutamine methyltransferase [Candidatus Omnitrophica bacterium]|nr:peptide chain release factor N(5)-glutamine methyltransferase [Candidatus Omnitrophota bacterium]
MSEEEQMLTSILGCSRTDLILNRYNLDSDSAKAFDAMKYRRALGEPLQYILGFVDFYGIKIFVDKRVLIPRPETELLAELAIEKSKEIFKSGKDLKVLDVGTGSGNISIAIAKNVKCACVTAIDKSKAALELAAFNAKFNDVAGKINFMNIDFEKYSKSGSDKFDVIVSNPPYIPTKSIRYLSFEVRQEPRLALDGGRDGLRIIERIVENSKEMLNEDGYLLMELGDNQEEAVIKMLEKNCGYKNIGFRKDYLGINRMIISQKA